MIDLRAAYLDFRLVLAFIERTVIPPMLSWLGISKKPPQRLVILPLEWLDENKSGLIKTLAAAQDGISCSQKISGVQANEKVLIPAVKLYRFDHAECCGSSSSIVHDGRLILERVPGVDSRRCNYAKGHVRRHGASLAIRRKDRVEHIEKGIFLGGNGISNYYHWMIEILPKLEFLEDMGSEYSDYPLLIDESTANNPSMFDGLNVLKGVRETVILRKEVAYHVNTLLYLNSPCTAPFNLRRKHAFKLSDFLCRKDSVLFVREALLPMSKEGENDRTVGKRLFLARRSTRRNYNHDEVFAVFEQHGFVKVFMEDYSLRDQIALISNADMLAGPPGAAWTNIIFCRIGTKCLSWTDEQNLGFSAFSNLAYCVGSDLRYVYRTKTKIKATAEFYSANYHVSGEKIQCELNEMLADSFKETPCADFKNQEVNVRPGKVNLQENSTCGGRVLGAQNGWFI